MVKECVFLARDIDIGTSDFLLSVSTFVEYWSTSRDDGQTMEIIILYWVQCCCCYGNVKWLHRHNMLCISYILAAIEESESGFMPNNYHRQGHRHMSYSI